MSKRFSIFITILALVLAPLSTIAATRMSPNAMETNSIPGPTGTFGSAFTIQNLSNNIANCSYQFFDTTGTVVYTSASFQIPAQGSTFTYVPNISGFASGQYSSLVACDQPVAAIVNTTSANSAGSYDGVSNPGTTWYAPNAFNNYYNYYTNFVVQNATGSPVDMTLQALDASGNVVATQTASSVPAYSYHNFDQTGLSGLISNTVYSAKITGTGAVAVEANIYGQGSAVNQLYSYTPFTSGSKTAYAPVIMNNYFGYLTALTVQNMGGSTANVTVTYGTGLIQSQSISPNSSYVFYTPNTTLPSGTLTSAMISSDQNIVALVNESNSHDRAASYSAFASGATTVSAPIVLRRYFHYSTSVTCQNIGTSSTNMTIKYSNAATSTQTNIPQNGTALFYQPNDSGIPDGFNGSATITSSSQPIICIVNEDQNEGTYATTSFDQLLSYEGIGLNP